MSPIARGDAVALTRALTAIDSRNPTLAPGAPGESNIAHFLSDILGSWGFRVDLVETAPGRPNLVAHIGPRDSAALMFCGHLDTVGTEGMVHEPFSAEIVDGLLYGRGSADMKSGIAAMCSAAYRAYNECDGTAKRQIIIAAVTDEEYESIGLQSLIANGIEAEAAILTEPTRLAICTAHRGFVWSELEFAGRAAHGSRYDIGIDAITHAALVVAELDRIERNDLHSHPHPLLGRASLHASTISGGIGLSTYPDRCVLQVERRTIPGEVAETSLDELRGACDRVREQRPELDVTIRLIGAQAPSDVAVDAPVVRSLVRALESEKLSAPIEGLSAWTDAALLNEAGITAVCFGPGDIALAHSAEEYVPVTEIDQAAAVLTRVAREWMMETA